MEQTSVRVWTKQSAVVWDILQREGIYHARRADILRTEEAALIGTAYDWLAQNTPGAGAKPKDAEYPIWLSFSRAAAMLPTPGTVVMELAVDPESITRVNIAKWGAILNYSYIPKDPADARRHQALLREYGTGDARAMMTPFFPQIRREITDSWKRLFDDSIQLGSPACYGNIWEVRREWIQQIIQ